MIKRISYIILVICIFFNFNIPAYSLENKPEYISTYDGINATYSEDDVSLGNDITTKANQIATYSEDIAMDYWSEKNAPEFYGTTKIVIKKGEPFSLKDARFRIFARDFEDIDLTQKIVVEKNNVKPDTVGDYEVVYSVTDSHNNKTTITVPVKVVDEKNQYDMIEKTFYSLLPCKNLNLVGVGRNNNHDRQMLGFYLKNKASLHIKRIDTDKKLLVQIFNNDQKKEKGFDIKSNDWIEISNEYDGAPFYKTMTLDNATPIKMQIAWDNTNPDIMPINYYHYGDNEQEFKDAWAKDVGNFGIVGSGTMMVYIPYEDRPNLLNHWKKSFKTFDSFLEYYQKVYDRYDEILGVSLNPDNPAHQNVRAKWFVKANAHGAGSAYYAGDHVGVNKPNVASFFEGNWGGLHELGHGYQGELGRYLSLGEVSNNIFAYYVQTDPSIYPFTDRQLGELSAIEQENQNVRLNGGTFNDLELLPKLYFLISMFESIDSANTYTNIFKFYREQRANGIKYGGEDTYALAIAQNYGLNIVPYFNAWGLYNTENVKYMLRKMDLKNIYPLKDLVVDEQTLNKIKTDLGFEQSYRLVKNETLAPYNLKGNLNISINIDDIDKLIGKKIFLKDGQTIIKTIPITSANMSFTDIPVGAYTIEMPSLVGQYGSIEPESAIISNGQTLTKEFTYIKTVTEDTFKSDIKIQFQGYYYPDACEITLGTNPDNKSKQVSLKYRGTTLWSTKDDINTEVKILDENGQEVYKKTVKSGEMFPDKVLDKVDVKTGYKLVLTNSHPDKLKFINMLTGDYIKELETKDKTTTYVITEDGLKKEGMSEQEEYTIKANNYKAYIDEFVASVSDQELRDKNAYLSQKQTILEAYNFFDDEDKASIQDIYNKITLGFEPVVVTAPETLSVDLNKQNIGDINFYSLITVEDVEDSIIDLDASNTNIKLLENGKEVTNIDVNTNKTYTIFYEVKDTDNNVVKKEISLNLIAKNEETTTETTTNSSSSLPTSSGGGFIRGEQVVSENTTVKKEETTTQVVTETATETTTQDKLNIEEVKLPEDTNEPKSFEDVSPSYWAFDDINKVSSLGIINGYDGKFNPTDNIKRGDVTIMITKLLGLNAPCVKNFDDVKEDSYYYNYVGLAKDYGIVNGNTDNKFYPENSIKREDVMVIINNVLEDLGALEVENTLSIDSFSDSANISSYAKQSVDNLIKAGIIQGKNGEINPKDNITRAEFTVILGNVYDIIKIQKEHL